MPGGTELIWVLVVIVVLFGASRLPAMGRNLGLGIKEFKKGVTEATRNDRSDKDEPARPAPADERERGTTP
jgi:sec-independent protein translocase protein TatA